jgi:hypothetical protein
MTAILPKPTTLPTGVAAMNGKKGITAPTRPMTHDEKARLIADVEAYCNELRPIEELAYVERRFNPEIVNLAKKHNICGMPIPT